MRIVFIGPPGAGKGTQCRRLSQHLGVPHLSTGEMLRAAKVDPELGARISGCIDRGNLVPDELVTRILIERLSGDDCDSGYLLDGYPRTVRQAEMLDDYLTQRDQKLDAVLELSVDREVLVRRLVNRATIENRVDDTEETIQNRLKVFFSITEPVIDYYRQHGLLLAVDGDQPLDGVSAAVMAALELESR